MWRHDGGEAGGDDGARATGAAGNRGKAGGAESRRLCFFDAVGRGHLDHAQIAAVLAALRVPVPEGGSGAGAGAEDYARREQSG